MEQKPLPPGFQSRKIQPLDLPNPALFRQVRPAILGDPPVSVKSRLFERKRVILGLCVVVALHASLGFAWWLLPPLRLKAGIDPARWVPVVSVPQHDAAVAPRPAAKPAAQPGLAPLQLSVVPLPSVPVPVLPDPAQPTIPQRAVAPPAASGDARR